MFEVDHEVVERDTAYGGCTETDHSASFILPRPVHGRWKSMRLSYSRKRGDEESRPPVRVKPTCSIDVYHLRCQLCHLGQRMRELTWTRRMVAISRDMYRTSPENQLCLKTTRPIRLTDRLGKGQVDTKTPYKEMSHPYYNSVGSAQRSRLRPLIDQETDSQYTCGCRSKYCQ